MNTRVRIIEDEFLWGPIEDRINEVLKTLDGTLLTLDIKEDITQTDNGIHHGRMVIIVWEPPDTIAF